MDTTGAGIAASLSFRQLKLFESVGRLNSVRKASEECNLSQPAVLRAPRVVHEHRPLRDRSQRKVARNCRCARPFRSGIVGEVFVEKRQRVEETRDA